MAPIFLLLQTVFTSILEVFLLCVAGYILARRGVLDKRTQKQLNRLNVSLFTPSLLFSKVAFSLSPAKLRELWIIPIVFVVVTTVSMSVSYTLGWIFGLKKSQRSFAMAAAMFMNSNSLPIALMQSLVVTVHGLKWDADDTKTAMLGRALTYLVLYSTLGMVLRWSFGVHLLTQADEDASGEVAVTVEEPDAAESPLLSPEDEFEEEEYISPGNLQHGRPNTEFDDADSITVLIKQKGSPLLHSRDFAQSNSNPNSRVFFSFPNTPSRSPTGLPHLSPASSVGDLSDHEDELPTPIARPRITPTSTRTHAFLRRARTRLRRALRTINAFMTVPLWAALTSLIVALIQPLQHLLAEHSSPITGALSAAGNCSIPLTLVVLGAYFYTPREGRGRAAEGLPHASARARRASHSTESEASLFGSVRSMLRLGRLDRAARPSAVPEAARARPGETKTVAIAVLSRMVIVPLLLLPLMALSTRYDYAQVFDDPIFVLSNVLLISSPPALTLAQITQAASGDAFERLISRTIFWAYCVITPPATIIYVLVGLLLAKI